VTHVQGGLLLGVGDGGGGGELGTELFPPRKIAQVLEEADQLHFQSRGKDLLGRKKSRGRDIN